MQRRSGWRALLVKSAAFVKGKLALPFILTRDRFGSTWPDERSLPDPASLHAPRPAFLVRPETLDERASAFNERFADQVKRLIQRADLAAAHRVDLLGLGDVDLGETIDWRLDYQSGIRFGHRHHLLQTFVRKDASDVKVPWELARLQHLPLLAVAFRLTGKAHYAQQVLKQIEDFCQANPPRVGIHWTCAMEVGLRMFSVALATTLLGDWMAADPDRWRSVLRLAQASGDFIEANLEYDPALTTNHYLADLLGLLALGVAFPELGKAEAWRTLAVEQLQREMEKQFYPDGPNFEASLPYHRLSLEIMTAAFLLCRQNGLDLGSDFRDRLQAAFRFTSAACYPNGTVPLIGDNDSGRVLKLLPRPDKDHHYLCELGTALFGESLLRKSVDAPDAELFWWLDGQVDDLVQKKPRPLEDFAFLGAGRYFFESENAEAAFVCGPVGQSGNGGHAHNDALSFTAFVHGREVITDPGTFCYTADATWRNRFRETAYHNTVRIDGREINPFHRSFVFHLADAANAKVQGVQSGEDYAQVVGRHRGYGRLPDPVDATRTLRFYRPEGNILIRDRFDARDEHSYEQRIVLAPGVEVALFAEPSERFESARSIRDEACPFWLRIGRLVWTGGAMELFSGDDGDAWCVEEICVSPGYGAKEPSTALVRSWTQGGPCERVLALVSVRSDFS